MSTSTPGVGGGALHGRGEMLKALKTGRGYSKSKDRSSNAADGLPHGELLGALGAVPNLLGRTYLSTQEEGASREGVGVLVSGPILMKPTSVAIESIEFKVLAWLNAKRCDSNLLCCLNL